MLSHFEFADVKPKSSVTLVIGKAYSEEDIDKLKVEIVSKTSCPNVSIVMCELLNTYALSRCLSKYGHVIDCPTNYQTTAVVHGPALTYLAQPLDSFFISTNNPWKISSDVFVAVLIVFDRDDLDAMLSNYAGNKENSFLQILVIVTKVEEETNLDEIRGLVAQKMQALPTNIDVHNIGSMPLDAFLSEQGFHLQKFITKPVIAQSLKTRILPELRNVVMVKEFSKLYSIHHKVKLLTFIVKDIEDLIRNFEYYHTVRLPNIVVDVLVNDSASSHLDDIVEAISGKFGVRPGNITIKVCDTNSVPSVLSNLNSAYLVGIKVPLKDHILYVLGENQVLPDCVSLENSDNTTIERIKKDGKLNPMLTPPDRIVVLASGRECLAMSRIIAEHGILSKSPALTGFTMTDLIVNPVASPTEKQTLQKTLRDMQLAMDY